MTSDLSAYDDRDILLDANGDEVDKELDPLMWRFLRRKEWTANDWHPMLMLKARYAYPLLTRQAAIKIGLRADPRSGGRHRLLDRPD